jgi:uncharacterized protein YecE (DUF72 family)
MTRAVTNIGANSRRPVSIAIALAEYAEVFKTVCVDAAYYTFPSQQYLERMVKPDPG